MKEKEDMKKNNLIMMILVFCAVNAFSQVSTRTSRIGQGTVRVPRGAHLYIKGWLPSI